MDISNAHNIILSSKSFNITNLTKKLINSTTLVAADLLAASFTLVLVTSISEQTKPASVVYVIMCAISVVSFFVRGHYHKRIPFWEECKDTIKVLVSVGLLQGTINVLLPISTSATIFVQMWFLNIAIFILARNFAKFLLAQAGTWQLQTVIIGDGSNAIETAFAITGEKLLGYEIIAFLSTKENAPTNVVVDGKFIPVRQLGNDPEKFLRRLHSPHIIVALEQGGLDEIQNYFDRLSLKYSQISVVPAIRGLPLFGTDLYQFFSHEVLMLNLRNNLGSATAKMTKRAFVLVFASLLLISLSPVLFAISIIVRRSGRQVIFGHERIGREGKPFMCLKFRTMVENSQEVLERLLETDAQAKAEWNKDFKLKNDPRITPIGRFLRKTSLDELPQLINVIRGEMSLVGPRPVIHEEVLRYGKKAVFYYKAKPGITGLWQVSGRNDLDYESRIDLDVWYVRNWSLWNDIIILFRTVGVVLKRDGAY